MQTMTKTLQKLIGKPLVESTDQEIYLALLDLVRSKSAAQVRPVNGRKLYYISAEFFDRQTAFQQPHQPRLV